MSGLELVGLKPARRRAVRRYGVSGEQIDARIGRRFEAWLSTLPFRLRQIAESLAKGHRPGELAAQLGISPSRLSQLRMELRDRWSAFCGEAVPVTVRPISAAAKCQVS